MIHINNRFILWKKTRKIIDQVYHEICIISIFCYFSYNLCYYVIYFSNLQFGID